MGDVVNLKRFKKRASASSRRNRPMPTGRGSAGPNPNAFGTNERAKRASDLLDQHRIDGEDAS